jgi:flagellar FliJ protein
LIDLAEERSKLAAQELQRLRQLWSEAEQKLDQLKSYLAEYQARLAGQVAAGMPVARVLDFQRFIAKLERAIHAQSEEVARRREQWETARRSWMEREREVKAYRALRERHVQEVRRAENRSDQRMQDEFAHRVAHSHSKGDADPQ